MNKCHILAYQEKYHHDIIDWAKSNIPYHRTTFSGETTFDENNQLVYATYSSAYKIWIRDPQLATLFVMRWGSE